MASQAQSPVSSDKAAASSGDPQAATQQTILVVDDRAINRDFLISLLKHFGYKMREAESAEQAWGMAVSGGLDLIITDVQMPGMGGLTLLEKLAGDPQTSHIPAILYTAAYKNPRISDLMREGRRYAILSKPSAPEAIIETVQSVLGSGADAKRYAAGRTENPGLRKGDPTVGYRATALIEMMQDLAEERDLQRLPQSFCKAVKALLHAQDSYLFTLPGTQGREARIFSAATHDERPLEPLYESRLHATLSHIITGHAIGRFRQVRPKDWGFPLEIEEVSSLLCVPIFTASNNYGCVCLVGKVGADDFSEEDERLAMTFTSYLAALYESVAFYHEIQDLAAKLASEIEDRKRAEEELERSRKQQMRLKDEFLSHVSHELRSPVMTVQQFLEILQEGATGPINAQQREYVDIALRNTNQLSTMIGDLLDAARIEAGKLRVDLEPMDLPEVLHEAVASARPAAEKRQVTLTLDLPGTLPLVVADRSRVRQIVTNLLDNAIKFTGSQGSVAVKAAPDPDDPRLVRLQVSDTGCGLSPEDAQRVFERHFQVPNRDCAARKGLGLGLCICKELVTLQGGDISVKSQSRAGSEFSFTLPIFSVIHSVTPVLRKHAGASQAVVLSIEVPSRNKDRDNDLLLAARQTIEHCTLPDLDVVLPGSYPTRVGRMIVLFAVADQRGVQVMTQRIEGQLKLVPGFADGSSRPVLRSVLIDLSQVDQSPDQAGRLSAAALRVDAEVTAIIAQRS